MTSRQRVFRRLGAAGLCTALGVSSALPVSPSLGRIDAVEVTLYMPCNQETANRAIEALGRVPGVARVDAAVGSLRIRAELGEHFAGDPLDLVQLLWTMKIFPNHIHLEGEGHLDDRQRLVITAPKLDYRVRDEPGLPAAGVQVRFRAEVLDWIEDRAPRSNEPHTLRLVRHEPVERS